MKKQNKIYLPLKEQGIKKAWDKAVIFKQKETGKLKMVVYNQNKPFYYWFVDDAFDVSALRCSLACMLDVYNTASLNERRLKKWHARNFVLSEAGERVSTYRIGGVLSPEV
jgi:hypothetical protein